MSWNVISGDADTLEAFIVRIRMAGDDTVFHRFRLAHLHTPAIGYRAARLLFSNRIYVRWDDMKQFAKEMGLETLSNMHREHLKLPHKPTKENPYGL